MTTYATLTEHNEWEGETWRFYIPIEGNEEALNRLVDVLTSDLSPNQPATYHLGLDPRTESEVDHRIEDMDDDDIGYMAAHNKLAGRLTLPDDLKVAIVVGDLLYKGGVKDLMEAP